MPALIPDPLVVARLNGHALGVPPPVVVDPVFLTPVVVPVDPASAFVALEVAGGSPPCLPALIKDPLVVAVLLDDPVVTLAPLPCGELVAGDPPVVAPVIEGLSVRVPPAAVIGAVVDLVVGPGALLPDPVAVARLPIVLGNAGLSGNSADSEKRK